MTLRFIPPQSAAVACDASLLDVLSEFIDANADTVYLMTCRQETELEWSAHCDYLPRSAAPGTRDARPPRPRVAAPPRVLVAVSGLNSALSRGWTAAHVIIRGPARAAQAPHPRPNRPAIRVHPRVWAEHAWRYGYRPRIARSLAITLGARYIRV